TCGMCKRIKKGQEIRSEKLAEEIIKQVGPGGEYLTHKHTFQNFRKEFYAPIMEERNNFIQWTKKGSLSIEKIANQKWKDILSDYEEPSLPEEIDRELRTYMEKKRGL
ncbi:MAG: trimethylamine methyltransferase family protein, partial [Thermodesulfobacteriota bacterium]